MPKRPTYDAFANGCPSRAVLDLIANKWTALVMCTLRDGPVRFGVLRRRVDGITQKMLSQTLRALERDGFIHRQVFATVPPSVEYSLTARGAEVVDFLVGIRTWSEKNVAKIMASRASYDARVNAPSSAPARLRRGA